MYAPLEDYPNSGPVAAASALIQGSPDPTGLARRERGQWLMPRRDKRGYQALQTLGKEPAPARSPSKIWGTVSTPRSLPVGLGVQKVSRQGKFSARVELTELCDYLARTGCGPLSEAGSCSSDETPTREVAKELLL